MSNRNNRRPNLVMPGLAAGLLAASNVVCAQNPCEYEVTAIIQAPECPPFGFPPTIGMAISEPIDGGLPNVVGYYQSCTIGPDTAFLWIGNEDKFIRLDMPPNTLLTKSRGISPSGQAIVGEFDLAGDGLNVIAFLIDGEKFIEIPPAGGSFSQAWAVNNQRPAQIVGTTVDPKSGYKRAFVWQDFEMTLIEPTFGPRSAGRDMAESGAVVGWMGTGIGIDSHVFLWEEGVVTDLGLAPGTFSTSAKAINNVGQIATGGTFDKDHPKGFISGGFLWEDGVWTFVGMLPGYDSMALKGLNDAGEAVGWSRAIESSGLPDTGFIWQEGVMRNLNDLIAPDAGLWIKRAEAINQFGQITGHGIDQKGDIVAFVLTPIDPPLGDLDGDCTVGTVDLLILLGDWGPCQGCPSDLDGDGIVGVTDLLILLGNWG